jgi:hypothetical protein
MYKPSTYLVVVTYFPTYLPIYETYFLQNWLPRSKPNINSVEVHPQMSNNGHPVDGALVGAGSLWPLLRETKLLLNLRRPPHTLEKFYRFFMSF